MRCAGLIGKEFLKSNGGSLPVKAPTLGPEVVSGEPKEQIALALGQVEVPRNEEGGGVVLALQGSGCTENLLLGLGYVLHTRKGRNTLGTLD